ncbi:threonine aspartase 1 isoform X2 [Hetaerina americana]
MVLEASPLTNAGHGSNLNINGNVEVDAGAMEGERLAFGGVGAVPGMCHPVLIASEICKMQYKSTVTPSGLMAPSLIVGSGAAEWAQVAGLTHALSSSLISEKARKQYNRNKRKLDAPRKEINTEMFQPVCPIVESKLDTVGVVAMDGGGRVSAVCSSGGIALKHPGRVGQAAIFGAGCWAENAGALGCNAHSESIAACTTGCGEYLVRTGLARELAHSVRCSEESAAIRLHSAFVEKFLESPLLQLVDESGRLAGTIVLRGIAPLHQVEFLWAHSTKSMCIGYMTATHGSKPKSHISRLPQGFAAGSKVIVEGISLDLNSTLV